jgi:hypothetical protein
MSITSPATVVLSTSVTATVGDVIVLWANVVASNTNTTFANRIMVGAGGSSGLTFANMSQQSIPAATGEVATQWATVPFLGRTIAPVTTSYTVTVVVTGNGVAFTVPANLSTVEIFVF